MLISIGHSKFILFIFFLFLKNIYFGEEEHKWGRGRERGDRGSEAGSAPTAESPTQGLNPQTARS